MWKVILTVLTTWLLLVVGWLVEGSNLSEHNIKSANYHKTIKEIRNINIKDLSGLVENQNTLEILNIRNCTIRDSYLHDFHQMTNLKEILIEDTKITLKNNSFEKNVKLITVKIINSLQNFPADIFNDLPMLETVVITKSNLTGFFNFARSTRIKKLDLSSNLIVSIPPFIMTDLPNLLQFYLNDNLLSDLSPIFGINDLNPHQRLEKDSNLNVFANNNQIQNFKILDVWKSGILFMNIEVKNNKIKRIYLPQSINNTDSEIKTRLTIDYAGNPIECSCENYEFLHYLQNKANFKGNLETVSTKTKCYNSKDFVEFLDLGKIHCESNSNCLENCKCYNVPFLDSIFFNCSRNNFTEVSISSDNNDISNLSLKLDNKIIETTVSSKFSIDISDNAIEKLTITPSKYLTQIDLRRNKLQNISNITLTKLMHSEILFYIDGNDWICNCKMIDFYNFVNFNPSRILDYNELRCNDGKLFKDLTPEILCPGYEVYIAIFSTILAVFGTILAIYYKYKKIIKMWLYVNNLCECFIGDVEFEKDKRYDAFVMYSYKDGNYVSDNLVAELEEKEGFKLCCHERDWPAGPMILDLVSFKLLL